MQSETAGSNANANHILYYLLLYSYIYIYIRYAEPGLRLITLQIYIVHILINLYIYRNNYGMIELCNTKTIVAVLCIIYT
jgi:hypothetical protein